MNWKSFALGALAGFAAGYGAKMARQSADTPPETILSHVKSVLKKDGRIQGSWIIMKPEAYEHHSIPYTVYRGGITKVSGDMNEQYEFIADSKTGTILNLISH
ncbi:hypothetical protein V1498_04765 [Peribacillus sp. SCS-26]|uniref:hypothetical protein n=1 Tax=Paraperibacillus TaxID=3450404 RepID=UPI003905B773